jgi:hypothetical protein
MPRTRAMSAQNPIVKPRRNPVRKNGRPSLYTPEIAEEIISRLSEGEPLAHICRDDGMPAVRTVSLWKETQDGFAAAFGLARDVGFDALAARCLEIANTPLEGVETITDTDGKVIEKRADMLGHRKLQIETILKLLAKWDPRRYGERLHTDVQALDANGKPTSPLLPVLNITIAAPREEAPKTIESSRWRDDT